MPRRVAYFDCFAGAGGDMIVASLLSAGADFDALREQLARLDVGGYTLRTEPANRQGMIGTRFVVDVHGLVQDHEHTEEQADSEGGDGEAHEHPHGHDHDHAHEDGHGHDHAHEGDHGHDHEHDGGHDHEHTPEEAPPHEHHHRGLDDILRLIDAAQLPPRPTARAKAIFTRLGHAEAKVHGVSVNEVHFHEVGAVDSIIDIVGACLAMEQLGIDRILCAPIPLGSGRVRTAHGLLPVPAPATAELLVGARTAGTDLPGEVTTPTAAAIFTTLAESYGPMPGMDVTAVGLGAGTRTNLPVPNLLRVFVGEVEGDASADTVVQLSANLDDCTGEIVGVTLNRLLTYGALDAWAVPITMKKSRPAWMLCALCSPSDADALERILFEETTTFGVRRCTMGRSRLQRSHENVETPYGPVRVKIGKRDGAILTAAPEFEDCLSAAESHHVSVREVMDAARLAYGARTAGS